MSLIRLVAVVVTTGLLGSPLSGLYCSENSEAARACCRNSPSSCNQPGKTDDCCHVKPTGGSDQGLLPAAKADLKAKALAFHAALPVPTISGWDGPGSAASVVPQGTSPPPQASSSRSLVLRI